MAITEETLEHPKTSPWTRQSIELAEKRRIAKGWGGKRMLKDFRVNTLLEIEFIVEGEDGRGPSAGSTSSKSRAKR